MLSHDAVIHNARVNFEIVIAKNYSPTVLAMELGVEKEIESLLTDPTVGDLYNWDPWTIMLPGPPAKPSKSSTASLTMDPRPVLLDKSIIGVVFWRRENGLL